MTVIARWTIEGLPGMDRELVNVSGPNIRFRQQVKVIRASDYDALAGRLQGAVDVLDRYARHDDDCVGKVICTCGLTVRRAALDAPSQGGQQ